MTISAIWRQQQKVFCHIRFESEGFVYFTAYVLLLSHKNSFDLDSCGAAGTEKAEGELFMASNLYIAVTNSLGRSAVVSCACEVILLYFAMLCLV